MGNNLRKLIYGALASFLFLVTGFGAQPAAAQTVYAEGALLQISGDGRIYAVSQQRRRHIASEEIFRSYGFSFANVRIVDAITLQSIPATRVIKSTNDATVFDVTTGLRIPITSAQEFLQKGFAWNEIITVNPIELASYALFGEQPVAPTPTEPVPATSVPMSHPILEEINQARTLLHGAPPIYAQEKRLSATGALAPGSSGSQVIVLQQILQKLGYFPTSVTPNGVFGPTTEAAVKAFQKAQGIEQLGSVGPQTLAALEPHGLLGATSGQVVRQWQDIVPADRDVLLAVWREQDDTMQLVHVTLTASRPPRVISHTPGFTVRYSSGNGVNVQYAITSPTGYQVLANRFPIFDASPGKVGTFPPSEEVYVPFSAAFLDPVIVASGRAYLDNVVSQAIAELRQLGVRSVTGNGLIADNADPNIMKSIALIEHIDTTEFMRASNKDAVVNKVFAILATNQEDSYKFSGSSAGALGLAQFIPSTYASMVKRYPSAKLLPGFKEGMANHVNAFKAMMVYNDSSSATLESYARQYLTNDPAVLNSVMGPVLAAAYNGGATRVRNAIARFGDQWQTTSSSTYGLRNETKSYLEKFRAATQWLLLS